MQQGTLQRVADRGLSLTTSTTRAGGAAGRTSLRDSSWLVGFVCISAHIKLSHAEEPGIATGGLFGFRLLKLNKNISLFSGIAYVGLSKSYALSVHARMQTLSPFSLVLVRSTGIISGYVVSRTALQTRLARAEANEVIKRKLKEEQPGGSLDVGLYDDSPHAETRIENDCRGILQLNRREGGFGGMESFEDKYATTR